jgi:hypothetical protein
MKVLLFLSFIILAANAFAGINRYVKQGNPTSNNGLTYATAVGLTSTGSLPNSFLATVQPGDTLLFIDTFTNASYTTVSPVGFPLDHPRFWHGENTLRFNNLNGTPGNYITLKPYDNTTLLKGDGGNILRIQNSSYLRIEGFNIKGEVNNLPLSVANALQFVYILNTAVNLLDPTPAELHFRDEDCISNCMPDTVVEGEVYSALNPNNVYRPTYYDTRGIYLSDVHHIEVINNHIQLMPGGGLRVSDCEDIIIKGNEINDCSRRSSGGTHGLVVTKATSTRTTDDYRIMIINNLVHHNYNEQYSWSPEKTIITPHIDEGKGISLQRNQTVPGVNWNHGRILIQNNICYYNGYSGIHSNDGFRIDIINNTCYFNSYTGSITYGQPSTNGGNIGISLQGGTGHKIINNISVIDGMLTRSAISTDIVTTSAHPEILFVKDNIIYSTTGPAGTDPNIDAVQINTRNMNPQFVNQAGFDFHLLSTSPAINTADPAYAPATDYYGATRSTPDVGAVEYLSVLPVKLEQFNARMMDCDDALFTWKVSNAVNFSRFELQISSDGNKFEPLTIIPYTPGIETYSFNTSNMAKGVYQYRLKLVDLDGKFSYSNISLLNSNCGSPVIAVFPNPATSEIFITNFATGEIVTVQVFDINGKLVLNNVKPGDNIIRVSVEGLPKGTYLLKATSKSNSGFQKIVIQ